MATDIGEYDTNSFLFILVIELIGPEIKSWLNSYKTVAKKMRGDLEIILSEYYNDK